VLSPDVIWLAICQGVSIHVNQNFKKLEKKIFKKSKPDTIEIRNDSLYFGEIYWNQLIDSLSFETKQYTNADLYDFFVADFSTTTPII
jgi:hypothetical protein